MIFAEDLRWVITDDDGNQRVLTPSDIVSFDFAYGSSLSRDNPPHLIGSRGSITLSEQRANDAYTGLSVARGNTVFLRLAISDYQELQGIRQVRYSLEGMGYNSTQNEQFYSIDVNPSQVYVGTAAAFPQGVALVQGETPYSLRFTQYVRGEDNGWTDETFRLLGHWERAASAALFEDVSKASPTYIAYKVPFTEWRGSLAASFIDANERSTEYKARWARDNWNRRVAQAEYVSRNVSKNVGRLTNKTLDDNKSRRFHVNEWRMLSANVVQNFHSWRDVTSVTAASGWTISDIQIENGAQDICWTVTNKTGRRSNLPDFTVTARWWDSSTSNPPRNVKVRRDDGEMNTKALPSSRIADYDAPGTAFEDSDEYAAIQEVLELWADYRPRVVTFTSTVASNADLFCKPGDAVLVGFDDYDQIGRVVHTQFRLPGGGRNPLQKTYKAVLLNARPPTARQNVTLNKQNLQLQGVQVVI